MDMAVKTETFNAELYDLLKSKGYNPKALNSIDKDVNPEESDVFAFKFIKNGKNLGTGRVRIDDNLGNLILYTNDNLESSPETNTSGTEFTDSWTGFKRHLRKFAKKRRLQFEIRNDDHLHDDMKKRTYMKKKEKVVEGYYPINKTASYSDSVPQVKMIIQHSRQIQEGEQRYRNVARIFVENTEGERFLLPTKRPGIAKVYARHIAEGGTPYDDKGKHITSLVEEYTKMAGFVRATKNGQFNESAQQLVNEGVAHYESLRHTLGSMISQRGYHKYFDNYTPMLNEETTDATEVNELFVQETVDPRIESVMPILARLRKNISEMSEVKELDQWAENLVNETIENIDEAPGAETLGHNQRTAEKNLKAFDLEENLTSVGISDGLAAKKIANKLKGLPVSYGNIDRHVSKYLDMVGKSPNDVKHLSALVMSELEKMGLAEGPADAPVHPNTQGDEKGWDDQEPGEEEVDEGHAYSDRPYVCVHAKKGKCEVHADSSYEAVKKAAQKWGLKSTSGIDAYLADVEHKPVDEDLGPEQKKVGQLGPTEKVGPQGALGKLVGASDSVENDELNRIKEMIGYK